METGRGRRRKNDNLSTLGRGRRRRGEETNGGRRGQRCLHSAQSEDKRTQRPCYNVCTVQHTFSLSHLLFFLFYTGLPGVPPNLRQAALIAMLVFLSGSRVGGGKKKYRRVILDSLFRGRRPPKKVGGKGRMISVLEAEIVG